MKKIGLILTLIFIVSCAKEQRDLTVTGNIKGLKKGIVYLKKPIDTVLVTVDSLVLNGTSYFELHSDLDSPQLFYLNLDKNDNKTNSISFFADKGIIEINTTLKNFIYDVKIKGSKHHEILEDYRLISSKFNSKNLDLLQENFEAQKDGDTAKLNANQKAYESLLKRKYLYTANFAVNHSNSEVAPFLALSEIYDAHINLLDTINNSLTDKVKASTYGKKLEEFIAERKKEEDTLK